MPTIEINPGDRLKVVDPAGSVKGEFGVNEDNGSLVFKDDQGNPADQKVGALEANDQPEAEAELSGDISGVTAGDAKNIVDTTVEDNGDLLNASQEITPSETADYRIEAYALLSNGSQGDRLEARLFNKSTSTTVARFQTAATSNGGGTVQFSHEFGLNAGDTYVVRGVNRDSQFTLEGNDDFNELEIEKSVTQS